MRLSFTKKSLFDVYVSNLQKQKIPTNQLESAHLKMLMLKKNSFFKTICQYTIEDNELKDVTFINDKTDLIALAIEHTPLTPKMVEVFCEMVTRPHYSWWLKERIQENLNNSIFFRESFERIALDNSIVIPQMFR
jgi:Leucine-rich repeat (LRR) protein